MEAGPVRTACDRRITGACLVPGGGRLEPLIDITGKGAAPGTEAGREERAGAVQNRCGSESGHRARHRAQAGRRVCERAAAELVPNPGRRGAAGDSLLRPGGGPGAYRDRPGYERERALRVGFYQILDKEIHRASETRRQVRPGHF